MIKARYVVLAASLSVAISLPVLAIDPMGNAPGNPPVHEGIGAAPAYQGRTGAPGTTLQTTQGYGDHRVTGTISRIDSAKGIVQVKTDMATLQLYFPSQALRDFKQGDRITLEMAFTRGA